MINETVNHIVSLTTGASSGTLTGSFRLGFYGHYVSIDADASVATHTVVKAALSRWATLGPWTFLEAQLMPTKGQCTVSHLRHGLKGPKKTICTSMKARQTFPFLLSNIQCCDGDIPNMCMG